MKEKLYTNPKTGKTQTAVKWAIQLGLKNPLSFQNRVYRYGLDNPRTWETKKKSVMRRVMASVKSRQKKAGNKEYKLYEHSDAPDPEFTPGTWEAENLSHLGR